MKILALGDLHGDTVLARQLAEKAEKENADLVIITGDLTHGDRSCENLIGPFREKNRKVLFVPGNHDSPATADFLVRMYGIKNLHGYSARYDDIGIFGCSGVNIGLHSMPEEEIFRHFNSGFEKIKHLKKKIMVSHVHPSDTKMEKFTTIFKGSDGVRKAIDLLQPDIMLCSHVHEAEGIEEVIGKTRVINVGRKGTMLNL